MHTIFFLHACAGLRRSLDSVLCLVFSCASKFSVLPAAAQECRQWLFKLCSFKPLKDSKGKKNKKIPLSHSKVLRLSLPHIGSIQQASDWLSSHLCWKKKNLEENGPLMLSCKCQYNLSKLCFSYFIAFKSVQIFNPPKEDCEKIIHNNKVQDTCWHSLPFSIDFEIVVGLLQV